MRHALYNHMSWRSIISGPMSNTPNNLYPNRSARYLEKLLYYDLLNRNSGDITTKCDQNVKRT